MIVRSVNVFPKVQNVFVQIIFGEVVGELLIRCTPQPGAMIVRRVEIDKRFADCLNFPLSRF